MVILGKNIFDLLARLFPNNELFLKFLGFALVLPWIMFSFQISSELLGIYVFGRLDDKLLLKFDCRFIILKFIKDCISKIKF